jgi:hypothetical protein
MIGPEEIAKWAELYDLGFNNLDMNSQEAGAARRELYQLVRELYATVLPYRGVPFAQFNSEVIRKIKAYLRRS